MYDVRRQQHKQQRPVCCLTRFLQPPAKPPYTWPPTLPNSGESQLDFHQRERYEEAFDNFIKMQYDDSSMLLNAKVTHGCVVRICIDRDIFLQAVNDKGYGQNGDFEFVFGMMSLHLSVLPKQRNSRKSHYPLVNTWFEYCWRSFPTLGNQLNLVNDRGKIGLKGIWVLVMLVYDSGKIWSSSIWVSEEVHMVHIVDKFDSREIETSDEYPKELILPAYEFHLCKSCEWQEHVKMYDNWSYFLPTPFVEMYEAYSHVSSCGKYVKESTFSYAIISWCDGNEVHEPTIENFGDTWAHKNDYRV
ncbi:hypothetical protein TSUD_289730 [Trifolium subterraneum]|uniref:Uncharacterized protein n=1 Tax=Trifolium subterraneum TaxID=3900 RepID=A0A2Z6MM11_TRISU|nr:hypothetical protein TSUD_289730 [Trifolium subterraneum]